MEDSELLAYILIGGVIWCIIMYAIIHNAVKAATKSQNYNLIMLNRQLIIFLKKNGVDQNELVNLHNMTSEEFWKYLEGIKQDAV